MKKRLLSLLLALTMCLSLSVPAFASAPVPQDSSKGVLLDTCELTLASLSAETIDWIDSNSAVSYINLTQQVVSDFEDLGSAGILSDFCTPHSIRSDGKIVYNLQLTNTITNQVTTHRNTKNQLVVEFYEGNKHDTVVYLGNGSLLVNGCLVDNQNTTVSVDRLFENTVIQPRARYDEFSLSPWGSASEYTINRGTYKGNLCPWGVETIANLTVGAVAAIICEVVQKGLGFSLVLVVFTTVASAMINSTIIYGMEDAYFSWEFSVSERQGSFILENYYEYDGACYSRRYQDGTEFEHTFYRHNYFS